jgi:hypothetical protein
VLHFHPHDEILHQIANIYKRESIEIKERTTEIIHTKTEVFLIYENHRFDVEKYLQENNKYGQQ